MFDHLEGRIATLMYEHRLVQRLLLLLKCLVICTVVLPSAWAFDSIEIVDGSHGSKGVGKAFVNRFSVASKEEALSKLQGLQHSKVPVTVQEFLGGRIKFIRVAFYDTTLRDFAGAKTFLESILGSIIISSSHPSPSLQLDWAEGSTASIEAEVFFNDGTTGRIETDGSHLFLEDNRGTYWWHRWDSAFPREEVK
jgi:hypothetical protein